MVQPLCHDCRCAFERSEEEERCQFYKRAYESVCPSEWVSAGSTQLPGRSACWSHSGRCSGSQASAVVPPCVQYLVPASACGTWHRRPCWHRCCCCCQQSSGVISTSDIASVALFRVDSGLYPFIHGLSKITALMKPAHLTCCSAWTQLEQWEELRGNGTWYGKY
jgi:hypothetical protein